MASNGAPVTSLTSAQRRQLAGPALANSFNPDLRLYRSFEDWGKVYEYGDLDLRAMRTMLAEDGNPRKLEQVLTLPIRSANWEITGGSRRAAALVKANLEPLINRIIDQCTSAFAYRRAFFETLWALDAGQVVYDQIVLRPAVACEASFRDDTGQPDGFRQRLNPVTDFAKRAQLGNRLGWVDIPANRSFVFTYGAYREPISGVSDLDVSLRCWQNIKKLEFLWCQYLEQQSLPKVLVYGDDDTQAQQNAEMLASASASATIPLSYRPDSAQKVFDVVESSGRGADQFQKAILYFSSMQTQSVLASFTDLAQNASMSNAGSNALSADQSEFYLQSSQARADEMAEQINCGLIGDLVAYNYGPDEECPQLHFQPIGNRQTDRALALMESIVTATKPNVPFQFTAMLLNQTASALGLDNKDVEDLVVRWGDHMQAEMEAAQAAQVAAASQPTPMANPSTQQPLTGTPEAQQAAQLAAAIDVATELNVAANEGHDPVEALNAMKAPVRHPRKRGRR